MINIIYKKLDELIPYINNPRNNKDAVDKVASSIKNFGFKVLIIVDRNNEIVAGNTRLEASKKLGMDEVPCIVADDLTEAQIKAFRIADNKVSEYSEWDEELLKIELEGLDGEFTGFDVEDIEELNFENVGYKEKETKEKETILTIKFGKPDELKKVENDVREVLDKYEHIRVVVSSGEV